MTTSSPFQLVREAEMASDFLVQHLSNDTIDCEANRLRNQLDLTDVENIDVVRLLEFDLEQLIEGFRLVIRDDSEMLVDGHFQEAFCEFQPPRIVVSNQTYENAAVGDPHARMVLAHELGHLLLHSGYNRSRAHSMMSGRYENDLGPNLKSRGAESQAKRFAAFFLMPRHIVKKMRTVQELSRSCGTSLEAAEIRFNSFEVGKKRKLPNHIIAKMNEFKRSIGAPEIPLSSAKDFSVPPSPCKPGSIATIGKSGAERVVAGLPYKA